jgi:glucosamine-6-phosphate deaminase
MPQTVIITRDFDHMSDVAAEFIQARIARTLEQTTTFNLGLATGNSPTGVYRRLARAFNERQLKAESIRSFNLDEYAGLPGRNAQARALHPESYSFFMIQELFGLLHPKFAETHVPWGCLIDQDRLVRELEANPADWHPQGEDKGKAIVIRPDAASDYLRWIRTDILDAYEQLIRQSGGIDLHLIGVGGRGHVAFHEAGIPFEGNHMLLVKLDDNTVDNAVADGHFASRQDSPRYAVSMGAALVYRARAVVLLAAGPRKAEPVAASLLEEPSPAIPISHGQLHARDGGDMVYVIDLAAASGVLEHRKAIESRGIAIHDRTAT